MKIQVLSDLHIEFAPFDPPDVGADVLVLAGDICTGARGMRLAQPWSHRCPVVYVAGNHEYYSHALPQLTSELAALAVGTEVHFLENRAVVLDGVRFLGCTLWTDFELFGPTERVECMLVAERAINDYRHIRRGPQFRRLQPADTRELHLRSAEWLREALASPFDGPTVIVTHHAPSRTSIAPRFYDDRLSAAFASNLDALFAGSATLWIHGHTHTCTDYTVANTRVVANQRGYEPDERVAEFDPGYVIDILV